MKKKIMPRPKTLGTLKSSIYITGAWDRRHLYFIGSVYTLQKTSLLQERRLNSREQVAQAFELASGCVCRRFPTDRANSRVDVNQTLSGGENSYVKIHLEC